MNIKKYDNILVEIFRSFDIDFVYLIGYMNIVSNVLINEYKDKIFNIHPSLLPKYKGLNTHKRVIDNKEKFSGCTVHFVSSRLDSGKIVLQKKVKVLKNDNEEKLSKRILIQEHKLYPMALKKLFY